MNLDYHKSMPAIGFETATHNANNWHKKMYINAAKNGTGSALFMTWVESDKAKRVATAEVAYKPFADTAYRTANLWKVYGYIPLNFFVGIYDLYQLVVNTKDEDAPNRGALIARACIVASGLGILLLVPDLIATAYYSRQPTLEYVS